MSARESLHHALVHADMPAASFDGEPHGVVSGSVLVRLHPLDEDLADLHVAVEHDTDFDHGPSPLQ